jgi:hypothetical protein
MVGENLLANTYSDFDDPDMSARYHNSHDKEQHKEEAGNALFPLHGRY